MDRVIRQYAVVKDDLVYIPCKGVAYQKDTDVTIEYDHDYYQHYLEIEGTATAKKLNEGRAALVNKYYTGKVLDVGIGSGEFIRTRDNTYGYDVNPYAIRWLKSFHLWEEDFSKFKAFTFWDVIEHVESPQEYLDRIPKGAYLFTCLPIFSTLEDVKQSKHYKPGEHLYYWTREGFINWMDDYGFTFIEMQDYEIKAGREEIYSFAFKKR